MIKEELNLLVVFMLAYGSFSSQLDQTISMFMLVFVTILRDTVTTSWSADDICFLILNISCWSDILVLYVFSSTLPVLACYSALQTALEHQFHDKHTLRTNYA